MKASSSVILLVAIGIGLPASSFGAIVNGSFASGLTGWSVTGNVAVDTSSKFGPPAPPASAQAVLGTAETSSFLFGGAVVSASNLETALGIGAGSLGSGATVGSALEQSITSNAGDRMHFDWKFMTNEPQPSAGNDTAFLVVDGALTKLVTVNSALLKGSSPSPLLDETAYTSFLSAPLTAGAHMIGFGIVDVHDTFGASALAITNVTLATVPEPSTWLLLTAGLAALLGIGRTMRTRT